MKAIDAIKNKIKKSSRSTVLFWIVSFIAVLAAVLPLITGAQLVLSIFGVGGIMLAGWQKVIGDREQDQKFDQEHKAREEAEQNLLNQTEVGKQRLARSRILNSMNKNNQEPHS